MDDDNRALLIDISEKLGEPIDSFCKEVIKFYESFVMKYFQSAFRSKIIYG